MANPVYSRLSGSTSGKPIPVAATSTPGTTIHVVASAPGFDAVYLYASNVTDAAATLTIEFGGTTDPGDHLIKAYSIPANSAPVPVCTGQQLSGGLTIAAFSSAASAINITGYAIRQS